MTIGKGKSIDAYFAATFMQALAGVMGLHGAVCWPLISGLESIPESRDHSKQTTSSAPAKIGMPYCPGMSRERVCCCTEPPSAPETSERPCSWPQTFLVHPLRRRLRTGAVKSATHAGSPSGSRHAGSFESRCVCAKGCHDINLLRTHRKKSTLTWHCNC